MNKKFHTPTIVWHQDAVRLIDQTQLPEKEVFVNIKTPEKMYDAIQRLVVRGAPAIGCAAAYGVVLGIQRFKASSSAQLIKKVDQVANYLAKSRPTAVNLFWALDRMKHISRAHKEFSVPELKKRLLNEAHAILSEDLEMSYQIGKHGVSILPKSTTKQPIGILTHCNAGGLATSGYGTALAVMFTAEEIGKNIHVYSDETRPLLQGSRLTAWELLKAGIPVTTICDNMAAEVMREGKIHVVITGADRIAANGDSANKIGTFGIAVLAKYFNIPFYIAAPSTTFDLTINDGSLIPIEERSADEIRSGFSKYTAPRSVPVYNPAFDVTPAKLITGIITEKGVIKKPTRATIKKIRLLPGFSG